MADFTNRNADETKEFILTFDENGGSPEYTKIEDTNGVDRTAEVVELLGINDKEDADSTILKEGDVEDSLNSTSTTKPLSANQGKQLNDDKASLSDVLKTGSNSNGTWWKLYMTEYTGLMIQVTVEKNFGAANGSTDVSNLNRTNRINFDYPLEFDSVLDVSPSITRNPTGQASWIDYDRASDTPDNKLTQVDAVYDVAIFAINPDGSSFWGHVVAIGTFDETT